MLKMILFWKKTVESPTCSGGGDSSRRGRAGLADAMFLALKKERKKG